MEPGTIEVRVGELKQLFNQMDPSPFRDRDIDPRAEEFIVGWAKEVPATAALKLLVHLDRASARPAEEEALLRESMKRFFEERSLEARRRLRELFYRGRISLVIGLMFLATMIVAGDLLSNAMNGSRLGEILRESLLIGGWVAMWRPLEVFLYDWWPVRAERRLYDRLSAIPVEIVPAGGRTAS